MKYFQLNFSLRRTLYRSLSRPITSVALAAGTVVLAASWAGAQAPAKASPAPASKAAPSVASKKIPGKIALIKSFRIVQEQDGPALEILSTKPLVPSIQAISDPARLVIDLPNARLDTQQKKISVDADQIKTVRADQFQENPPVARVVLDLLVIRAYTWDAAGNRLVVHLGSNPVKAKLPFQQGSPSLTSGPKPVVASVRAAGPLSLAQKEGGVGSTVTAGAETTILNLSSGGEVDICPGTTVSITPSQNQHNLLLSMNTGAMEAHFGLDASSDTVMTPDFRILLVGPGEFHYAISADTHGNTCVRALPGNTASAMVSELMGDRTYQVKATDQLVFRAGQLDRVDMAVPLECGCPAPREAPLRATNNLPIQEQAQSATPAKTNSTPIAEATPVESAPATGIPATEAPSTSSAAAPKGELHVQVEAPFVYRASDPPPAPMEAVRSLPSDSRGQVAAAPALATPLPPPAPINASAAEPGSATSKPAPPRGFFRKIGGFFASLFR